MRPRLSGCGRRLEDLNVGGDLFDNVDQAQGESLIRIDAEEATDFFRSAGLNCSAQGAFVRTVTLPSIAALLFGAIERVIREGQALVPIEQGGEPLGKRIAHNAQSQGKRATCLENDGWGVLDNRLAQ